jgi:hypothetical protein
VPPRRAPLGVKGPRPVVGTWATKARVSSLAALKVGTGQLTTRLGASPAAVKRRLGHSKTARLQHAVATHLRALARAYPATRGNPLILTIDNAPWPLGAESAEVLAAHPHLPLYRLPSDRPQLHQDLRLRAENSIVRP